MRTPENKRLSSCPPPAKPALDTAEMHQAVSDAFGDAVFVEINGMMTVSIGENVKLEIDPYEMEMTAIAGVDLQSHEPTEGDPDFNKFINGIALMPRLAERLLKAGFTPKEWCVNEYRAPGNGACSVMMSRTVCGETVEAFVEDVKKIKEALEERDT